MFAEDMEEKCIVPRTDTVSSEQEDRTFCRPKPPWRVAFTEQDMHCSDIRGNSAVSEPCDHLFRRRSLPLNRTRTDSSGLIHRHRTLFRQTKFPLNESAGGRNDDYIGLTSESNQSVCARPVTGSLYSRQVYGLHSLNCLESGTLLPDCNYQQTVVCIAPDSCCSDYNWHIACRTVRSSITVILIIWYCIGIFSLRAMASDDWAYKEESGPSYSPSGPLPGTFLGPALDIRSDSLYDLPPELQDVMGLRAVRPGAVVAKVMSVRNSRCIRVVTPDDHVTCCYHKILLHDLGEEDLSFVSISELDYLRRTWPRAVFAFMTRYQQDLELKRRECKERFGCTQSGQCTYCGKHIQMDLGKHISVYHLELAQLWRCPVMWCTVWKGTAQDCIDHMRRAHKLPLSVKAANLAKYFPAWTVSRVEWSTILMPCISGVAIDTLLFSHVGSPLCHRYRLISRTGCHTAFRGTYLKCLWSFIEEMDSAGSCQGPGEFDQEVSTRMVKSTDKTIFRGRRPRRLKGSVSAKQGFRLRERPAAEMSSVQALMALALPRFTMAKGYGGDIRRGQLHRKRRHHRHQIEMR